MPMYTYKATSKQLKQGGYDCDISKDYPLYQYRNNYCRSITKIRNYPKKSYTGLTQNKSDGLILYLDIF